MTELWITDTNALLKKPEIIKLYNTVIPSHVLREIEHLERTRKSDRTLQFEIRRLKRILDADETHTYVDLKDYKFTLDDDLDPNYVDNILIQVAVDNGYGMISNDRLIKEKCKLYNIPVLNLEEDTFVEHKGFKEKYITKDELKNIYLNLGINQFDLMTNEYIIIYDDLDGELLEIMKWNGEYLVSLRDKKGKLGKGFKTFQFNDFVPRDEQQIMAVDSILNNQLTSIRGRAGSGKSLIALNTAWYLVEKEGYNLVIFVNPVPSLNAQELGFYKGDRLTKLLQSAVGAMLKSKFGDEVEIMRQIQDGKLDILPFVDIRGYDTGDKTICWIVEAQNLTAELLKLGLQRIAEGSKVIVDGDYHQQIDKDIYIADNGMKRMSEVFRGTELYGEVELQNVHRSRIADLADKM
ncbi:PhoH family protein [Bacillus xiapuensis]|uniref:PhoH family protein n=1 Tax=Bacillus xiapuensis TaxID=2014075 RepID=A0ABU6NAG0_9BACI|nr:PhoH family protein [Bacillus xiapuensis]